MLSSLNQNKKLTKNIIAKANWKENKEERDITHVHVYLVDVLNNASCDCWQVKLLLVKDGSGLGAAFAAVSALRQKTEGLRCS